MLTDEEKALFLPDGVAAIGKTIHEIHFGVAGDRYMEFTDGTVLILQPANHDYPSDPYVLIGVHPDRAYQYTYACLHALGKLTKEEWDRRCREDTERAKKAQAEHRRAQYEQLKREFEPTYGPHPDALTNLSGIPRC